MLAVLLVIAGLLAFYYATRFAQHAHEARENRAGVVTVNVGAHECTPADLTVPAGVSTFRIVNTSQRAVEWEILDGVMVVEERENIAPGFAQTLSARLAPGDYDITCGLLSNPRGKLHVTPTAESDTARKAAPSLTDFIGPLSEYRLYLNTQATALVAAAQGLSEAIANGDTAGAKAAYAQAHQIYARMSPVADLFGDLDKRLDARANQFEKRELDPGFMGFHRVEYGLFGPGAKLGDPSLAAAARQLLTDTQALRQRVDDLSVQPQQMSALAARRIELQAADAANVSAMDDSAYDRTGLADVAATEEGTREIVTLMTPLLMNADAALAKTVAGDLDAVRALLPAQADAMAETGFKDMKTADRQMLATRLSTLATDLRRINPALGLN